MTESVIRGGAEAPAAAGGVREAAISRLFKAARASPSATRTRKARASASRASPRLSEPPLLVLQGLPDDGGDVRLREPVQCHHPAAREQRRDDLEGRVLGGGADEGDQPAFDVVQEGVLLGLVEAVDLVDEEHRAAAVHPLLLAGLLDHRPDLLDPGQHRREMNEVRPGVTGDDAGECRFPAAGRPPEDHGKNPVGLGRMPDQRPLAHDLPLADELVQAAGPHALGQRPCRIGLLAGVVVEEVHYSRLCRSRRIKRTGVLSRPVCSRN